MPDFSAPRLAHGFTDLSRRLLPVSSTLLLLALSLLPASSLGTVYAQVVGTLPQLAFIGVCSWAVLRPEAFGIVAAFLVGLLQDLLTGAPPGVTAFLYAFAQRQAARRRATLRPLPGLWQTLIFAVALLALLLLQALAWQLLAGRALQFDQLAWQWLAGTVAFVPVGWALRRAAQPPRVSKL